MSRQIVNKFGILMDKIFAIVDNHIINNQINDTLFEAVLNNDIETVKFLLKNSTKFDREKAYEKSIELGYNLIAYQIRKSYSII